MKQPTILIVRCLHDVREVNADLFVGLSSLFNPRIARRIWMGFCMALIPLERTPELQFSIFYSRKYQHGGRSNFKGGIDTGAT
jgi:hypothetical protein